MWYSREKGRVAIGEVLGSLIMIAITLTAGAAVFGYVNGLSGSSAGAVGNKAASNINFLNEHVSFVTVQLSVASSGASIWVYNNGNMGYVLSSIEIKSIQSSNFVDVVFTSTGYSEYDSSGKATTCTSSSGGFTPNNQILPQNTLSSGSFSPYAATIPSGGTCVSLTSGQGYTIKMTGFSGSSVQTTAAAQ